MNFQVMFFCVYIIESKKEKGYLYIGSTNNLQRRIKEHNNGENKSTKSRIPWKLIYCEASLNEKDAIRREGYLKTSQGNRFIQTRIKEYIYDSRHS